MAGPEAGWAARKEGRVDWGGRGGCPAAMACTREGTKMVSLRFRL